MAESTQFQEETVATESGTFDDKEIKLTPWEATGKFSEDKYALLVKKFGVELITNELLDRFEKVTGHKPHRLMRRGLFFAHRHLSEILDDMEAGKKIFIYTGRGPTSDALHLGHTVPIEFTAWLQKVFDAIVVFQMADDEKYWFKNMSFEEIYKLGFKNAKDIIALGFNPEKTFIFSNRDYSQNPHYIKTVNDIMKRAKLNDVQKIFGLDNSSCIGQIVWPIYQTAAAFSDAFKDIFGDSKPKCLVAYAIDQDPYFRLARDVAPQLNFHKPCSIMCQFLPGLEGDGKMSSSTTNTLSSTIFMTDTPDLVSKKIKKYAFSGGQQTVELHRQLGGNPDIDISYQWLRHFMEDDAQLAEIERKYRSGEMLTGELKQITGVVVSNFIAEHQRKKELVTDDLVAQFYDISTKKY